MLDMAMLNNTIDFMLKAGLIASLVGVVWQYFLLYLSHTDFYLKVIHFIRWYKFILSIIVVIIIMIVLFFR